MAPQGVVPPADGSVTLPEVIDFHTKHNPDFPIFIFNEDGKSEITKITYFEYGRACDRVAHRMRPGRMGPEGELVAVVALSDTLLYHAVSVGLTRAGMVPFLMSPRNTAAAIIKMLKETGCHRLLTTQETLKSLVTEIKTDLARDSPGFELIVEEMPPVHEIYPKMGHETKVDPFEEYPRPSVRPLLDNVLLYLHSSGSTGFPKSIAETFRIMCHWASFPPMPEMGFYSIGCMALPAFHTLGVISQLLHSTYALSIIALYPPTALKPSLLPVMPTPDNILEHLRRTDCEMLITIPALLQIWAQDKQSVDLLAKLKMIGYSGGSVPTKLGNFMASAGVTLSPIYGGTEFGGPTHVARRPGGEDGWEWIQMDERLNIRWDPQGDGTFECQFLTNEFHQVSVENMPDVKGYATSDLFIPHPTVPNFWKIVGRKDDVIIHTSGEKTVPAPMENIILNSPYTMGVVIFGREHDQPGVLIELKPTYATDPSIEAELIKGRNLIWPIVEEANRVAPSFSRIFKELILITSPNKPLPRAGKGTVMRKAALAAYHEEIEALYATIESTVNAEAVDPPPSWSKDDTEVWVKAQVEDINSGKTFDIAGDLFEQGLDSLSATILRRRMVGALQANKETQKAAELVNQNTIYNYPSIEKLSVFLVALVVDPDSVLATASKTDAIEEMITRYTVGLEHPIPTGTTGNGTVALLTGTTGNLGSQILETLLRDPSVRKIYALNRASGDALARHADRFKDKGFEVSLLSTDKLVFIEGDMTQKNVGLQKEVYDELLSNVTVIIHNAWRLDFNLQLASFEPNIRGTRNLIDLARATAAGASTKFLFTSSVASAISWDRTRGAYPEEVLTDPQFAVGSGYGEAKYVAERILSQSGIQATSFRIGQISGGQPNGAWAITDWVPILVKSSIVLKALPSMVGVSSWVPMHGVAQSIIDVALLKSPNPPALNIVHPRPIPFNNLVTAINGALVKEGISSTLPLVSFQEWFSLLEARSAAGNADDLKNVPAIKLIDFFRNTANADSALRSGQRKGNESGGMAEFSTSKAQSLSKTMKDLPPIGDHDAELWVKYWKTAGLFA
ncbi:hypothetical protein GALMADRAFT_277673 [Galerina marginata CBS 339.88]|uniref:Polyketide synthase phosphopantetheine-binding domain-containing protein n=1 Tax=Galerina marginata (strain CBS 339.88) TaxID=685588 RepID=A0A067T7P4_GALM3|nr:hypothetical protein GALMADRAFT_277673 [Galerina marginata CBS 339.88]